jgi:hypothetical protein
MKMNSCCTQPVEVIAADQHHGESCCLITEKTPAPAIAACPVSGTLSRKVQRRTLEHLLKPEKLGALRDVQYYYCKEPAWHRGLFLQRKRALLFNRRHGGESVCQRSR